MKPSLITVAVALSIIAIAISLIQPTYNFLTTMNKGESGTPSFNISGSDWYGPDFYVFQTFTRITLRNNGTATAHNVGVELTFSAPGNSWEMTEFPSEINAGQSITIEIPVGYYQLNSYVPSDTNSSSFNASSYDAWVDVTCKELNSTTTFQFQYS